MTLASVHHDAVKDWLAIPGNIGKQCKGLERKKLITFLMELDKSEVDKNSQNQDETDRKYLTKKQINNRLKTLLQMVSVVVFVFEFNRMTD